MTLGEKILKYRKQAGLSQEELADKTNVTRQSISLWETDQTTPSLDNLIMLAEIFAVSLDELCGASSKNNETAQPCPPGKQECLACAQTKYSVELIKHINRLTSKKFYIISSIVLVLSIICFIDIIISDADAAYLIIPIFFIVLSAVLLIGVSISIKKRTDEMFKLRPNCVAKISLFQDWFDLEVSSDNTDFKSAIKYSEVKKVIDSDKCILIYYGNTIVPIEKNLPDTDYNLILKLLNAPSGNTGAPQSKRIKALLLAMFILSLLSIFMALIATAICRLASPLPEFSFSFPEHMWVFFVFIPLPLASAILGIVFLAKKYKCKKNIIAGAIMCALLVIYGSFTFAFTDNALHDFGYVSEIEQTVFIELPDNGYISRARNTDSTTKSVAMIRFDNADEIYSTVISDGRFYDSTEFIPLNLINAYYASITSDYDYFMLFNVTDNEENSAEQQRYIFLAYNIDRNILFVLDFVK